jgi:hypothetical protein
LAKKLSRKWKKQLRQMHIKAFHKKIVLVSKQLPCTALALSPLPAKRPHMEVVQEQTEVPCKGNVIPKASDISPVMPIQPTMVAVTFLPLVPTLATVAVAAAAPPQDLPD